MKVIINILSSIIFFYCFIILIYSAGFNIKELVLQINIFTLILLIILFFPIVTSLILFLFKRNDSTFQKFTILNLILSLILVFIIDRQWNFKYLNDDIKIVSSYRSGMPKEIKYFNYRDYSDQIVLKYYENGNISYKVNFLNGVKSGIETYINENTSLNKINDYTNGVLIRTIEYENQNYGLSTELKSDLENLNVGIDTKILNDLINSLNVCTLPNRTEIKYFENGKVKGKQFYNRTSEVSKYHEYYNNGTLKEEGIKSKFDKFGEWKYYNHKGKIDSIEKYDTTGILIKKIIN